MKIFRYIFKKTGIVVLILLSCIIIYIISAIILSIIPIPKKEDNLPKNIDIYILTNGMHTDIVVPVKSAEIDWSHKIRFENIASKDTIYNYLAIGWGDKGFYMEIPEWSDLTFNIAFKAAFGLSSTAMHTTFYKQMYESENCKRIKISDNQYSKLIKYIENSFKENPEGNFINIPTDAVYGNSDSFYEAKGSYKLTYTCNTWTNDALKSCEQKACLWTPFDFGIFYHYK